MEKTVDLVIVGGGFFRAESLQRTNSTRLTRIDGVILDNHRYSAVKPSKTRCASMASYSQVPKAQTVQSFLRLAPTTPMSPSLG